MPHSKQAAKRARTSARQRLKNREEKSKIRTGIRKYDAAVAAGSAEAPALLSLCHKMLDQAGAKRLLHPNAAARKKGQLARKLASGGANSKSH
ncbi:MAG: 30S ribosomal protein S20 [Planctomycetes bacterium]|nr:30S ribosomal protein S20 [Planctomycetota bacterium]